MSGWTAINGPRKDMSQSQSTHVEMNHTGVSSMDGAAEDAIVAKSASASLEPVAATAQQAMKQLDKTKTLSDASVEGSGQMDSGSGEKLFDPFNSPYLTILEPGVEHPSGIEGNPSHGEQAPPKSNKTKTKPEKKTTSATKKAVKSKGAEEDEDIDDEQANNPSSLMLNRHIYTIYGPGVEPGEKVSGRIGVEAANSPYYQWPLYNDFKPIVKEDQASWPPAYVNLQDWHIWTIIRVGLPIKQCHDKWPADFDSNGKVQPKRKPKGRAAKLNFADALHYAVVCSTYQLSGDEASQAVTHIPANKEDPEKAPRTRIGVGQFCEVQDDFIPTLQELQHGTLKNRLHPSVLKLRPLNNRGDWGPEDRTGPAHKGTGRKSAVKTESESVPKKPAPKKPVKAKQAKASTTGSTVSGGKSDASDGDDDNDEEEEVDDSAASSKASTVAVSRKRPSTGSTTAPRKAVKKEESDSPSSEISANKPTAIKGPIFKNVEDISTFIKSAVTLLKTNISQLVGDNYFVKEAMHNIAIHSLGLLVPRTQEAFNSVSDTDSFSKIEEVLTPGVKTLRFFVTKIMQSEDALVEQFFQAQAVHLLDGIEQYSQQFFSTLMEQRKE